MRKLLVYLLTLLLLGELLLISACATSYRPIHAPATIQQTAMHETEGLEYAYRLDVLSVSRNRKYAKKEVKTGFRLVALQVTNLTEETIRLRDDVKVYIGGDEVAMVEPAILHQQIKQITPLYLLYGLIVFNYQNCSGSTCDDVLIPVGLVIGLLNILLATQANKTFKRDMLIQSMIDREIQPGQTVSGLLGIYSIPMGNLSLKLAR